jgi:hypothetical protein
VSSRTTPRTNPNFAQGQVKVIINYQKIAQRNVTFLHQATYHPTTNVDECLWLGQQQFTASYFTNTYPGPALPPIKADRMMPGEIIQAAKANIMPIMSISLARIAQANNEFHGNLCYIIAQKRRLLFLWEKSHEGI